MFKQFVRKYALLYTALILGALAVASALWELGHTAFYVHKAIILPGIVTDVRQRPFESLSEALTHGNLCPADATAYQAFASFTLPAGITINKCMPDLDCDDYALHQAVEIITHPHDPNQAHIYKAKFLCGWALMKLSGGLLLFLPAAFILRNRYKRPSHSPKSAKTAPKSPIHSRDKQSSRKSASAQADDEFALVSPEPAPAKKRRPRKQTAPGGKKSTSTKKKSTSPRRRKKDDRE